MGKVNLADVLNLSVEDRITLAQRIWDSLAADSDAVPLAPEQRAEIERRLGDHERYPSDEGVRDDTVVSRDPEVHGGDLVFAGTRVPVNNLIDYLKGGHPLERFMEAFPTVERWQVEAFLGLSLGAVGQSLALPAENLESAALALPPMERARLADRLLASLTEDGEAQEAWAEEIRRRLEAYRSGRIESVQASRVIEEAREARRQATAVSSPRSRRWHMNGLKPEGRISWPEDSGI